MLTINAAFCCSWQELTCTNDSLMEEKAALQESSKEVKSQSCSSDQASSLLQARVHRLDERNQALEAQMHDMEEQMQALTRQVKVCQTMCLRACTTALSVKSFQNVKCALRKGNQNMDVTRLCPYHIDFSHHFCSSGKLKAGQSNVRGAVRFEI